MNKSNSPETIKIGLPGFYKLTSANDILSSNIQSVKNDSIEIELPAMGYKIFTLH